MLCPRTVSGQLGIVSPEFRRVGEKIEIERVIAILEEYPLAPIAALGHVVGDTGEDYAWEAGHDGKLTIGRTK